MVVTIKKAQTASPKASAKKAAPKASAKKSAPKASAKKTTTAAPKAAAAKKAPAKKKAKKVRQERGWFLVEPSQPRHPRYTDKQLKAMPHDEGFMLPPSTFARWMNLRDKKRGKKP
jgi:hypothetical protein